MTNSESSSGLSPVPSSVEDFEPSTTTTEPRIAEPTPRRRVITSKRKRGNPELDVVGPRKRTRKRTADTGVNEHELVVSATAQREPQESERTPRRETIQVKAEMSETEAEAANNPAALKPPKGEQRAKQIKNELKVEEHSDDNDVVAVKTKRKRKTKEEKEAAAMPVAARTVGSKVLIGAHVSSAGGVHNAILNSVHIGGNAMALFLKSQRKWGNPPLQDEHLNGFLANCQQHKYGHHDHKIPPIVPHGSYLVNLAHPDPARTKQAYGAFLDDLQRCAKLGIRLYNFHPGSCGASESRAHAIAHLAKQLNKAHKDSSSGKVITLLETMTSSTNILGATFEDLADTIAQIDDKERVGVCLDTCHVFAAGYDLRTPGTFNAVMDKFDKIIGLKYLKALHMNDSKAPFNSGRDLHANIGTGFLGLRAFHNIMNEPRLWGLPMVLETPIDVKSAETGKEVPDKTIWAREIKLLESLVGMNVETEEFEKLEAQLHDQGREERGRIQAQVDKKAAKRNSKQAKAKAAATKNRKAIHAAKTSSDDESA